MDRINEYKIYIEKNKSLQSNTVNNINTDNNDNTRVEIIIILIMQVKAKYQWQYVVRTEKHFSNISHSNTNGKKGRIAFIDLMCDTSALVIIVIPSARNIKFFDNDILNISLLF